MPQLKFSPLFGLALLAGLGGCAARPDGMTPLRPIAVSELASTQTLGAGSASRSLDDHAQWSFGDPQLGQLMAKALADSPRYAQALSRVRKADALIQEQGASRLPQIAGDASATESKLSENNGFPAIFIPKGLHSNARATLGLSWDADVFGRNRAAVAAATSEAQAMRFEADVTRMQLRSSLALAYNDYARTLANLDAANQLAGLRARELKLAALRVQAGIDPQMTLLQSYIAARRAQDDATTTAAMAKVARFKIAALVGAGPDFGLGLAPPTLIAAPTSLDNLGTDAVAERADVLAARTHAEAAAARVRMASRDFYPNISLSALAGFQSLDVGQLLLGGSTIPSFGAAIHLPIFSGGRLRAAYRSQQADYDGAVAGYNETLVNALQEVSAAAARLRSAESAYLIAQQVVVDADKYMQLARERFAAKLTSEVPLLAAKVGEVQADQIMEQQRLLVIDRQIDLIHALGGHALPTQKPGNK